MDWTKVIKTWLHTPVKVLDIRHLTMQPGETLHEYRLPASAFLYTNQGEARLKLDELEWHDTHSYLLHGGKGATLHIQCLNDTFDYYLILYKALPVHPPTSAGDRSERSAPFNLPYSLLPRYPLSLLSLLERMDKLWSQGHELERLQVSGLFYQFVHEQFQQLKTAGADVQMPDLATQIARYINEHYDEAISMDALSSLFHYSAHYLVRVFKRKYECSPNEYLIRTRMHYARLRLAGTEVPIKQVAESVGYTDMYYFSKLFKKVTGLTPSQFKVQSLRSGGSIRPNNRPESFIAPPNEAHYIINKENHYQYNHWGGNEMKQLFKPSLAVSLWLSLSLLLAACGGAGATLPEGAQEQTKPQQGSSDAATEQTRMYTDAIGRQVEIPVEPKKVVVVTYGGYLLPLGMKPIGADQDVLDQYPDEMAGIENIGEGLGNKEKILALQPDLIIVPDYFDPASFEAYSIIAPTITVAWGGDPDVITTMKTMGDIMNRTTEAEAWIAKFEEKLETIREQIKVKIKPGTTAITFIIYNGEVLLGGKGGTLGKLVYEDFGFQMPQHLEKYTDGGGVLSMEELVNRPADYFFTQMKDNELPEMTERFSEPLYQSVPAIQEDRVINVTRDKWNYGPYKVEEAVDELMEHVSRLQ
ncbi:AraC family transcriptional regulator [Paenibacillus paeoniae]|uniref:AraC family transcriptional regulator n=1 Tax=Paenibacillus paeoniae TaxID=2292705 RepID=A0A371PHU1_9BACL|nr:ABC transporter substrate-binding protein [Paenibacillus paeoniae]REK75781.1 AraC family transcriptional regulator [Paenibacillus paeoniae]